MKRTGRYTVTRDGEQIAWCATQEDAKAVITHNRALDIRMFAVGWFPPRCTLASVAAINYHIEA